MSQQNLFDLNASKKRLSGGASGSRIPAGIHTNVTITGLELGPNYVDIFLEDSEGREQKDRQFFPDKDRLNVPSGQTLEQAFTKEVQDRVDKLVQYMQVFMSDDELAAISTQMSAVGIDRGFEVLAKKAVEILPSRLHSAKVNIKLIPDKDLKWPEFPRYPLYVEKFVEGQEPTLKYTTWELETRINKAPSANSDDVITNRPSTPGSLF